MPDVRPNTGYRRENDFLDTGFADTPDLQPFVPQSVIPDQEQQADPLLPKNVLDGIFATLHQSTQDANPFMGSLTYTTPVRTPTSDTLRYTSPTYGYDPLNPELEHQYADRQGFLQSWGNSLAKFGATVGGTLLETLATLPQMLDASMSGDYSKIHDNSLTNSVSNWLEDIETSLPNYQSEFEEKHPVLSYIPFFSSLKTLGNTWGGVLKNLGFTVGAITGAIIQDAAIGAVTGGVGEAPILAPQMSMLLGKVGKIWATPGGAIKVAEALKNGMNVEKAINSVYSSVKFNDRFRYGLSLITSATAEGAFEAAQVHREIHNELFKDFREKYGRDPVGQEAKQIDEYAVGGANADLLANIGLLTLTNHLTLGSVLKPTSAAIRDLETKIAGGTIIGLQKGSIDVFETLSKEGSKFQLLKKTLEKPSRFFRTAGVEGFEEGSQYVFQRSSEYFWKRKFDDESMNDSDNFVKSIGVGLHDVVSTREGLENIFIGALSGALIHAGRHVVEKIKGIDNNTDRIVKSTLALLNSQSVSGLFQNKYGETVTSQSLVKAMQRALEKGDVFEHKNLQFQQLFNFISSGIRANRFDLRMAQLNAMKEIGNEEFEKMFGIDFTKENKKTVDAYVDGVIERANQIKENVEKVNTIFKNPFRQVDQRDHYVAYEEYKNQLALDLSEMGDNRRRLQSLSKDMEDIAPLVDKNLIMDLTHDVGVGQTIQRFEDRIKQIDESQKLLQAEKSSDVYKANEKEKAWLDDKIKVLQANLDNYDPDIYIKEVEGIINYYAHGNALKNEVRVHPIDSLSLLVRAQDSFKLANANNRALYHYQALTDKRGASDYIQNVLAENNANYARFVESLSNGLQNAKPADAEVVDIDENGNEVKPKAEEQPKKQAKPKERTEKEAKEAETAKKQYESKVAELQALKNTKPEPKGKTEDEKTSEENKHNEKISQLENELAGLKAKQLSDELSTLKSEEEVDLSEIENPENQETKKNAQAQKRGFLKTTLYRGFAPFVYINRVYSRNFKDGEQENDNLREVLFSQTPQQIYGKVQVNISQSTKGKSEDTYSKIERANVYRRGFGYDIDVVVDGKIVGKIQPGDGLFFKRGEEYVPLEEVTKGEYEKVTGNDPSTYNTFVNDLKLYREITDTIIDTFEQSGKHTFNNAEVQNLFNIQVHYGGVDYAVGRSMKLSDITYKTKGDFLVSIPSVYDNASGKIVRSSEPAILNEEELGEDDRINAWKFIADNLKQLQDIDSRYIYVSQLPDGTYRKISPLAARPVEADKGVIDGLIKRITQVTDTTNKKDLKKLNNDLRNQIFISDAVNRKGSGSTISLSVNESGKVYMNVFNKRTGYRKGFFLPDAKTIKTLDDLVSQMNLQLNRKSSDDANLAKLNLQLDVKDFKTSIPNDDKLKLADVQDKLTVVAPHAGIFDSFSLHVLPLKSEVEVKPTTETKKEKPSKQTLEPKYQTLVDTIKVRLGDVTDTFRAAITDLINGNTKNQKEAADLLVSVTIDDPNSARKAFGDEITSKILDIVGGRILTDKRSAQYAMQEVFNLPKEQALAVAEIYDRVAKQWAKRTGKDKSEFYKNLVVIKGREDKLPLGAMKQVTGQQDFYDNIIRSGLYLENVFDTQMVARERFNIPELVREHREGQGSDRSVFDIGDNRILKVAKTARGLLQNSMEGNPELVSKGLIPQIYERGLNYVVVEKVEPAFTININNPESYETKPLLIKFLDDYEEHIKKLQDQPDLKENATEAEQEDFYTARDKFLEDHHKELRNILNKYGLGDILDRDLLYGDFVKTQNWGIKNGKLIHLDAGTFVNTDKFLSYKDKSNLDDDDYKNIYERSQKLKEIFGDTDRVKRYQETAEKTRAAISMSIDGRAVIYALTDPNVSSPVHELSHYWEQQLTQDELNSVLDWAGSEKWDNETSEKFAKGFEAYLAEGKTESKGLKDIFENFKKWLIEIYKGLVGSEIDVQLNDQMRKVYADMLGDKFVAEVKQEVVKEQAAATKSKRIVINKTPKVEQTQEVATQVAEEEHIAPQVQEQGQQAPEVQSEKQIKFSWDNLSAQPTDVLEAKWNDVNSDLGGAFPEEEDLLKHQKASLERILEERKATEEVPLEQAIEEQISLMRGIAVPDLHVKPAVDRETAEAEINVKYADQINELNNKIEHVEDKQDKLIIEEKEEGYNHKDKIAEYQREINNLKEELETVEASRKSELDRLNPQPEIEAGDKVMFDGKEVIVADKTESGNGTPVFELTDGEGGSAVVYEEKIYKIDNTLGEPVELPNAIESDIQEGDRVWFNSKQYRVVAIGQTGVAIEDEKGNIINVQKETLLPHDEAKENNYLIDFVGLSRILENLRKRFGINYSVVNDPEGNWKGRFKDGIVYINKANVDRTTPFHEYLHPLLKVMQVDNPTLYQNLSDEYRALLVDKDETAVEAAREVFENPEYKDDTDADKQDEALVRYISKLAAQSRTSEGKKVSTSYMRAMKSLIEKFRKWLEGIWKNVVGTSREKFAEVKIANLPENANLQDLSDMVALTDIGFDLKSRMQLVDQMDVFQKDNTDDVAAIVTRLKQNLEKFSKTAQRLRAEELSDEARSVRRLFNENAEDEAASLDGFVRQGLKGLGWANDEFRRIIGKLKNPENNLTQKDIRELNHRLDVVKSLLGFYKEDVSKYFRRIASKKDMDDEVYRDYGETIRKADNTANDIKYISVELLTEWLWPTVNHTNELIKEKYPDFVVTKEDFKTKLKNADSDVDRLFFLLGSVSSSKDPVSGVISSVLKDVIEDAHRYDAANSVIMKTAYDRFLKEKGLSNSRTTTADYYKQHYLRKARILEKTGENEQGDPVYGYVERWAFHQEYLFDKWTEEYEAFIDSLGERPEIGTAEYQNWTDRLFEWQQQNGTLEKPAERFKNPAFADLYQKDNMFTILHDLYNEGNNKLLAEEQLRFGIIPQVSKGKNMFSDLNWSKSGAKNLMRKVGQFFLPYVQEEDYDVNMENIDGSVYKRIKVAHIRPLDESDLDFALPETVFKFAGTTNLATEMRELEPNVRTLKSLIDGDSKYIKKSRGVIQTIKNTKKNKGQTVVNSVLSSKKTQRLNLVNKQLSAFIDDVFYGETEVRDSMGKFDWNQFGNNMAFLTALNNMAFNITAGISNVVIGNIQSFGEAMGGKYFKPANWRKGQAQYFGSFNGFIKDVSDLKKSKITQLGVKYDAIQGEFRDKYGKRFVGNVAQKYATSDTLFIINHAAEHQIQLTGMLALMDATRVQTTSGAELSLYDAHVISDRGYLKLRDDVIWTEQQNSDFTKRLHALNKILNGNYSKFDKAYLQRKWYGKLVLIYRKYLYNAFRARYGKKRLDYELQDVYEGYYRTFFNKLGQDIKAYHFEAGRRFFTRKGWTADEKYAYNKTMYELGLFVGITLLGIAIAAAGPDKDKDKSWGQNYLTLLMLRTRGDVGQYSMFGITDMARIMKNPSAVMQTLTRYGDFIAQLTTKPFETYKRQTGAFDKGDSVLKAKLLKAIPVARQLINLMQPEESKKFYTLINKNF